MKILKKSYKKIAVIIGILSLYYASIHYVIPFYLTIGDKQITSIQTNKVYTDDVQYKNDILLVMDTCLNQLERNNITTESKISIILCTTTDKYNLKTLYLKKGTLGIYHSLFNVIILAPADYKNNKQSKYDEKLINRRLSDVITHELTHAYVRKEIGFFKNLGMNLFQKWKTEGYCEYVANSSSFDINEGKRIFLENGDEQKELESMNNGLKHAYFYFKSRLKVDYLLSYKKISFDELFDTQFDDRDIESGIRGALKEGRYHFDKQ